jgi:hypothetical protein
MPCTCQQGKGASAQAGTRPTQSNSASRISSSTKTKTGPAFVSMRYTGPTSTTAAGTVSGRQYKFAHTEAVLQVDPRDKAGLSKVPHLRQI